MATINDPAEYISLKETSLWFQFTKVRQGGDRFMRILNTYTEITLNDLWEEYVYESQLATLTANTSLNDYCNETASTSID